MRVGTGGTFASDTKKIRVRLNDVQAMQEKLNAKRDSGWVPYNFASSEGFVGDLRLSAGVD